MKLKLDIDNKTIEIIDDVELTTLIKFLKDKDLLDFKLVKKYNKINTNKNTIFKPYYNPYSNSTGGTIGTITY